MSSEADANPARDPQEVLRHDPLVRGLARALVRDEAAAEDVAQQAWVAALARRPERGSLGGWLGGIVRNLADKARRGARRRERRERRAARPERVPSAAEIVEREAVRREIVQAVLALGEGERAVVLLRWFEGRPPREVARILGVPVETVRTRLKRAHARLRARLDHLHGGDRRAWGALVLPFAGGRGRAVAGGLLTGVTIMTTKTKIAAAGVVAAGLLTALMLTAGWPGGADPAAAPPDPAPRPARAALDAGGEETVPAPAPGDVPARRSAGEPVPAPTTGSLHVVVKWPDGGRAPDVPVHVEPRGGEELFDTRRGRTGSHGRFTVGELAPGRILVRAYRGGSSWERAEIAAGERTEVELVLDGGLDATGIVVGPDGEPVPGAEVRVAPWAGGQARPLTTTDDEGRFALRALDTHCHIGARAPGYAPSAMRTLTGSEGGAVELRLELPARGGGLEGRVLGPGGQPVADAVVEVDDGGGRRSVTLPDGVRGRAAMPVRARTGEEGLFVLDGLAAGEHEVVVRARRLAPWRRTVPVQVGRHTAVDVFLEEGVVLEGTARDETGQPLAGARVRVGPEWNDLAYRRVKTDEQGRYRIEGLEAGELALRARVDDHAEVTATRHAAAGETVRWDPVFGPGATLRGRVLDAAGRPVPGLMVEVMAHGTDARFAALLRTGDDGRFVAEGCPREAKLRLSVRRGSFPLAVRRDVEPGAGEVVVRLGPDAGALVVVTGRVVDPAGAPVEHASVTPFRIGATSSPVRATEAGTGAFRLGPYPPGEYSVRIEAAGFPEYETPFRHLGPDETWDLGTIRLERGGHLRAVLQPGEGGVPPEHRAVLRHADGRRAERIVFENAKARSGPLAPGRYLLQAGDRHHACRALPFEIRAGSETRLTVPLHAGIPVHVEMTLPAGAGVLEVTAGDGTLVARRRLRCAEPGKITVGLGTVSGRYRARVVLDDGRRDELEFTVGDEPVTVELAVP